MTDKNTAALAADHPEHRPDMVDHWYMVNKDDIATLCSDKAGAEQYAVDAQRFWPHMGPHRAVRLVEASFEAADMATAAADGFRDGVAHAAETVAELETLRTENETLTLYKNLADEYGLSIFKDLEDLGGAADDVQLLRMGYAAARLEIESLRAAQPVVAQQPGAAYAALPDEREAFEAMMRSQTFDSLKRLSDGSYESYEARVGWLAWNVRASHGQAPAQAAPSYKDSTPDLHVGDSAFESWYSSYSPAHKSDKQRARDAYAAGMGDPLVTAAPAAVAGPSEAVAYLDIGTGGYLDLGTDLSDEAVSRLPKGRHALVIAGTYGIDGYTAAPTTQPSPVAQGDAMDSGRLDWLALAGPVHICLVIDREHDGDVEVSLDGATGYGKTLRAAIDDARATQESKK